MEKSNLTITDDDLKTSKWNVTKYFETNEDIDAFLHAAFEEDDPTYIA